MQVKLFNPPTASAAIDRIKELAASMGLTLEQFNVLHPAGPDSTLDGFPSVLITDEESVSYKERLKREKEAWHDA